MLYVNIGFEDEIKRFSFDETCPLHDLNLHNKFINCKERVFEISITKNLLIISTEKSTNTPPEVKTDIVAYNSSGQLQWHIKDLIKEDSLGHIWGGFLAEKAKMADTKEHEEILKNTSGPIYACFIAGFRYVIDLDNKKVLFKSITK